jgi:hypothetical protein
MQHRHERAARPQAKQPVIGPGKAQSSNGTSKVGTISIVQSAITARDTTPNIA